MSMHGCVGRGRCRVVAALSGLAIGLGLALPASAQNALGDGRGLEANLNVNGRLNVQRPSFESELRLRNAIVTGNASFLSIRADGGEVGYTAPDSFRGGIDASEAGLPFDSGVGLGSNDLFAFRRDSLVSGLAGRGVRGNEALQFQMALTSGRGSIPGLATELVVPESGIGSSLGRIPNASAGLTTPTEPAIGGVLPRVVPPGGLDEIDQRGALLSLRSTSSFVSQRSLQPVLLRVQETATGDLFGLTASPLRGVQVAPLGSLRSLESGGAGLEEDGTEGRVDADRLAPPRANLASPTRLEPISLSQAPRGDETPEDLAERRGAVLPRRTGGERLSTSYDQLIADLNEAEARRRGLASEDAAGDDEPAGRPAVVDELRAFLREGTGLAPARPGDAEPDAGDDPDAEERSPTEPLDPDEIDEVIPRTGRDKLSEATIRLLLEMRERRESLIAGDTARGADEGPYRSHMRAGERLLEAGRWFEAEERFATALSVRPGDVSAQVGRLHAQIGGGLYVSAATNLRELLLRQPELAPVRYERSLLPSGERAMRVLERLRDLTDPAEPVGPLTHDGSLVLAYLSYQLGHEGAASAALDRFERTIAEGDDPVTRALVSLDWRLLELLRPVWTTPGDEGEGGEAGG